MTARPTRRERRALGTVSATTGQEAATAFTITLQERCCGVAMTVHSTSTNAWRIETSAAGTTEIVSTRKAHTTVAVAWMGLRRTTMGFAWTLMSARMPAPALAYYLPVTTAMDRTLASSATKVLQASTVRILTNVPGQTTSAQSITRSASTHTVASSAATATRAFA